MVGCARSRTLENAYRYFRPVRVTHHLQGFRAPPTLRRKTLACNDSSWRDYDQGPMARDGSKRDASRSGNVVSDFRWMGPFFFVIFLEGFSALAHILYGGPRIIEYHLAEIQASHMSSFCKSLQQRDAAAWDRFYQEHLHELYGFVFRLVDGDHSVAADVFQNIWLDAIDNIGQFDPNRGELRTWLFGIARQKIALSWRHRMASKEMFTAARLDHVPDGVDGALLPEDMIEQLERSAVVRAALLVLPLDRCQVLFDKYVDGLSVDQIAAKTGKSPKAVESLLTRARQQLRSLLRWYFSNSKGGKEA